MFNKWPPVKPGRRDGGGSVNRNVQTEMINANSEWGRKTLGNESHKSQECFCERLVRRLEEVDSLCWCELQSLINDERIGPTG